MNFTIALNTIIYVMVFLFPGILFRKFYYSGKFSNQFNQGNLLERFLWTLFLSIISLVLSSCIIYYTTAYYNIQYIHNIDFCIISQIFESLAINHYPDAFTNEEQILEIGLVIVLIWALSAISGYFSYKIVTLLSLDYIFSILRFNNEWHYVGMASKENGINRKWGDKFVTYLDILSSKKDKDELYRGRLKQFFLDKENKIEHIVIENPSKFVSIERLPENHLKIQALTDADSFTVHRNFPDKIVFKKDIEGKVFILPYENVVNINITYLKLSNMFASLKLAIIRFILFFFYIFLLALTIFPFVKIESAYFDTFLERLFFSIVTIFVSVFFLDFFKSILLGRVVFLKKMKENLIFISNFTTLYLYVFEISNGFWTSLIFIASILLGGTLLQKGLKTDTKPPQSEN